MPFSPLPRNFTDHLAGLDPASDVVLELGTGEGHFLAQARALAGAGGVACLGLDLRSPALGTVCDLVGDARRPPVRPGSVSVLVAANLVRHLVPRHRLGETIAGWRRLLKPGGVLFILEDEPGTATIAERNFRELQDFLAQLMPESRGPLLSVPRFRALLGLTSDDPQWRFGSAPNDDVIDATATVRFLTAGQGTPTGPLVGLIRSIGRDGLRPGRFWWSQVGPPVETS
jgi:SAM-dependent methyltransferase